VEKQDFNSTCTISSLFSDLYVYLFEQDSCHVKIVFNSDSSDRSELLRYDHTWICLCNLLVHLGSSFE
jgi:hypothetical protein